MPDTRNYQTPVYATIGTKHTLSNRAELNVTGTFIAAIMSATVLELVGKTLDMI
jgi:hypothetical protein